MKPNVEATYQRLGNFIVKAIKEDWAVAWLVAEIISENDGVTYGRYKTTLEPNGQIRNFETDGTVYHAFDEMRTLLRTEGKDPWTQAVFTLFPSGQMHIEFEYGALAGDRLSRMLAVEARKNAQVYSRESAGDG